MAEQRAIRQENERKRLEKQGLKTLEEMLWGVPNSCELCSFEQEHLILIQTVTAPELAKFWSDSFKAAVEAQMPAANFDGQ